MMVHCSGYLMLQKGDDECQVRSQVWYLAASSLAFFSLLNKTTKKDLRGLYILYPSASTL